MGLHVVQALGGLGDRSLKTFKLLAEALNVLACAGHLLGEAAVGDAELVISLEQGLVTGLRSFMEGRVVLGEFATKLFFLMHSVHELGFALCERLCEIFVFLFFVANLVSVELGLFV